MNIPENSSLQGLLLQVGNDRRLTVANHGFPTEEGYHPKPPQSAGRRIGRITNRIEGLDIALVQLDGWKPQRLCQRMMLYMVLGSSAMA